MKAKTKAAKKGRTEQQVSQQVVEAAAMHGIKLERQNTGMALNPKGQAVRFGTPGDADYRAVLPGGRTLVVEIKHENFDPSKLRGGKRAHFDRQLARLNEVNDAGGVGFWCDDADAFIKVVKWCLAGGSVVEPGYTPMELVPGKPTPGKQVDIDEANGR